MHYFEHNIKDYRADAFQLNLMQHGAYRQLLDQYYLNEKPLSLDLEVLFQDLLIRDENEKKTIAFILEKFFDKTEDGYVHKRCDVVIKKYKAKSDQSRNAANTRWGKEKVKNADAMRESCERNANQEPITTNKETHVSRPMDVNVSIWEDYMAFRKAKNSPMTQTFLKGMKKEAVQAGITLNTAITKCLENNWVGFKAEWLEKKLPNGESKPKEVWGK